MKKSAGPAVHEELAKTYFGSPSARAPKKRAKIRALLPWAVAGFALVAAAALVLSRSNIDVKVRLLGEVPSLKNPAAADKGLYLVRGARPEPGIVKDAYFTADARAFSASRPDALVLYNGRGAGWANYTVELKEPVDLKKLDLRYTAKGARSGEKVLVVIVDADNSVYRMERDLQTQVTDEWNEYTVNFRSVRGALDLSSVKTVKFEFGGLTAGNYSGAIIYIKDIMLVKTRRPKWL
jgi:hypothetical protein